jgi:uncharacterized protein YggE
MKRISLLVLIGIFAAGTIMPGLAAAADKNPSTINVTGHANVAVTPNVAYLNVGITTLGPDVESARADNERTMRRIIDALNAQGIESQKITTAQFSLQPVYNNDNRETGQQSINGYRLQNNVKIAVEALPTVGTVIDAAFRAGANQFSGLRFGLKDDSRLKEELLRKAVQDGRRKALIIADALGVTLGQPLSVSEAGSYTPSQADSFQLMKTGAGVPIEAGTQAMSLDVNMVFGIVESSTN